MIWFYYEVVIYCWWLEMLVVNVIVYSIRCCNCNILWFYFINGCCMFWVIFFCWWLCWIILFYIWVYSKYNLLINVYWIMIIILYVIMILWFFLGLLILYNYMKKLYDWKCLLFNVFLGINFVLCNNIWYNKKLCNFFVLWIVNVILYLFK